MLTATYAATIPGHRDDEHVGGEQRRHDLRSPRASPRPAATTAPPRRIVGGQRDDRGAEARLARAVCGSPPCSTGWYDIGGTSLGTPQWVGFVAMASSSTAEGGLIKPVFYKNRAEAARYANDFFDVVTGNDTADPSVPGYPATTGCDPITRLGTRTWRTSFRPGGCRPRSLIRRVPPSAAGAHRSLVSSGSAAVVRSPCR